MFGMSAEGAMGDIGEEKYNKEYCRLQRLTSGYETRTQSVSSCRLVTSNSVLLVDCRNTFTEKNGCVSATKLGQHIKFLMLQPNVLLTIKHFVIVTKWFCYPYFNK